MRNNFYESQLSVVLDDSILSFSSIPGTRHGHVTQFWPIRIRDRSNESHPFSWLELGCNVWHSSSHCITMRQEAWRYTPTCEGGRALTMPFTSCCNTRNISLSTSYYVRKWTLSLPPLSLVRVSVLVVMFLPNWYRAWRFILLGKGGEVNQRRLHRGSGY